jgi:SAM-dependent methyltransferase
VLGHLNFRRLEECETLLRWLDAGRGERVLDIGCGDGHYDGHIARSGADVVGIDVGEAAVVEAARHHTPPCTFLRVPAEELALPDGSFDKVVSFCVMEHLADDRRVMAHAHRLLAEGGSFVFSADSLSNPGLSDRERARHRDKYAVNTFYTIDLLGEKLDAAGFEIEEWKYLLNTPLALSLVRFSWALDDLRGALIPLKTIGYVMLLAAYGASRVRPGWLSGPARHGLTLLVRARKAPRPGARHLPECRS